MFPLLINPLPLLLTLTTSFSVLIHDTQIDRATTTALVLPVSLATLGAADISLKLNDPQVHPEKVSVANTIRQLRSTQPRLHVRDDKDRQYISVKKFVSDGMGSEYHWPSV